MISPTLYGLSVRKVVDYFDRFSTMDFRPIMTENMMFDVYWEMLSGGKNQEQMVDILRSDHIKSKLELKMLKTLGQELGKLEIFFRLLNVGHRRVQLHKLFQAVNNSESVNNEMRLCNKIANLMVNEIKSKVLILESASKIARFFTSSLNVAAFFIDGGWYLEAKKILTEIKRDNSILRRRLDSWDHSSISELIDTECQMRLLHVTCVYCNFPEAEIIYREMLTKVPIPTALSSVTQVPPILSLTHPPSTITTDSTKPLILSTCHTKYNNSNTSTCQSKKKTLITPCVNLPAQYSEFALYCFTRSQYQEAFNWSMEAVKMLDNDLTPKVIIDVLRTASKACVVRREFSKAEILIHEAVLLAREIYGEHHPKYADCLADFGFYLLNVDGVSKSYQAYDSALKVREAIFGDLNLNSALRHEDLAYATYVYEYNSGHFNDAKLHAETALEIMNRLLPSNHLLLASSQRVLALILEEIAIDHGDKEYGNTLLHRAEELHLSALSLAIISFGEMNVQTAKHYGNLGRLYQSMERFEEAQEMHLKAIKIKEHLLGRDDYEVALSIGHLASLYNYDMKNFDKAEELYLRSIAIGEKLFGPAYSGLEYDYRGLIRVYHETQNWDKFLQFRVKLSGWKDLRDRREVDRSRQPHVLGGLSDPQPIDNIINVVTNCKLKSEAAKMNGTSIQNMSLDQGIGVKMSDNEDELNGEDEGFKDDSLKSTSRERYPSDSGSTSSAMSLSM